MKRSNKNPFKAGSMERFHFNNSHWIRLPQDNWPKMSIQKEDLATVQHQPRRTHVNLGTAAPEGTAIKTLRAAILKKKKGFSEIILRQVQIFLWILLNLFPSIILNINHKRLYLQPLWFLSFPSPAARFEIWYGSSSGRSRTHWHLA